MRTELSGLQSLMDPLIAPMVVSRSVGFHRPRFQALESAIDASFVSKILRDFLNQANISQKESQVYEAGPSGYLHGGLPTI